MLSGMVCAALGAVGGAWARRSPGAIFPGACLALVYWLSAIGGNPDAVRELAWVAAATAPLLTVLLCRISKAGKDKVLDFPIDARLSWALGAGFMLRGVWMS